MHNKDTREFHIKERIQTTQSLLYLLEKSFQHTRVLCTNYRNKGDYLEIKNMVNNAYDKFIELNKIHEDIIDKVKYMKKY